MIETINKMNRISRQILQETGEGAGSGHAGREDGNARKIRKIPPKISRRPISMERRSATTMIRIWATSSGHPRWRRPTPTVSTCFIARKSRHADPREAKVLRMRFGIEMNTDHTLEEVGKQFDVTRERIRQIEAKALRKLRPEPLRQAEELPRQQQQLITNKRSYGPVARLVETEDS